jgi:hypothetical protein
MKKQILCAMSKVCFREKEGQARALWVGVAALKKTADDSGSE